jgi:hypothetical protein
MDYISATSAKCPSIRMSGVKLWFISHDGKQHYILVQTSSEYLFPEKYLFDPLLSEFARFDTALSSTVGRGIEWHASSGVVDQAIAITSHRHNK